MLQLAMMQQFQLCKLVCCGAPLNELRLPKLQTGIRRAVF